MRAGSRSSARRRSASTACAGPARRPPARTPAARGEPLRRGALCHRHDGEAEAHRECQRDGHRDPGGGHPASLLRFTTAAAAAAGWTGAGSCRAHGGGEGDEEGEGSDGEQHGAVSCEGRFVNAGSAPIVPASPENGHAGRAERGGLSKMAAAPARPLRAVAPPLGEKHPASWGGRGLERRGKGRRWPCRAPARFVPANTERPSPQPRGRRSRLVRPAVIRGRSGRRLRRRARSSARGRRRRAVHRYRSIGAWRSASFGGKNRQERRHSTGVQRKREPKQSAR